MLAIHKRNALKLIAACALSTGATALLSACSKQKTEFFSIDLTGATYAKDFALIDHHGRLRRLSDFAGKVVVLFFGYTQCPDVCPTSMLELAEVKKALGKDGDRLQGLFISLDPERDTPEVLKAYMASFDPDFLALRPTPDQLAALTKDFKVFYKKVEGPTPTSYTLDHSAGSFVYDPQGRVRLYSRYGTGPQGLTADIALLLKEPSARR